MKLIISIIGFLYIIQIASGKTEQRAKRLLCYYDSETSLRKDNTKFMEFHLKEALPSCSHLMYGHADLNPETFKLKNVKLSLNITELKKEFPNLKIFLSLGGDKYDDEDEEGSWTYMRFLKAEKRKQNKFINSAKNFLKSHDFDGLDLAFQFPRNKPRKDHTGLGKVYKKVKKIVTYFFVSNEEAIKPDNHKKQYSKFVNNLKKSFSKDHLELAMTVLPNVDSKWYFDIPKIQKKFEFINLFAFDFVTPRRNPKQADYTAPIYWTNEQNRLPYHTIDYQVNHWIHNGCPANKLNLGIATYGRAWKLSTDSGLSGVPLIENTKGPAEMGNLTKRAGLLSYSEICLKISQREAFPYVDKTNNSGNYAFKPADRSGNHGIWISFDDPDFSAVKSDYVISKNLGGVALFDLSCDDFRSQCDHTRFPILKSVSAKLMIEQHKPASLTVFKNKSTTINTPLYTRKTTNFQNHFENQLKKNKKKF